MKRYQNLIMAALCASLLSLFLASCSAGTASTQTKLEMKSFWQAKADINMACSVYIRLYFPEGYYELSTEEYDTLDSLAQNVPPGAIFLIVGMADPSEKNLCDFYAGGPDLDEYTAWMFRRDLADYRSRRTFNALETRGGINRKNMFYSSIVSGTIWERWLSDQPELNRSVTILVCW